MTFTTQIKDELALYDFNKIEAITALMAILKYDGKVSKDLIEFSIENAKVARIIFIFIKKLYNVNAGIVVRVQKRFRVKQIYIIRITSKINEITTSLKFNSTDMFESLTSEEEKKAFLYGAFFACGSINDPKKGSYHMEFLLPTKSDALLIKKLLKEFNLDSKVLKRNSKHMTYIKSAEVISDFLKLLNTTNALFYFEDIRIYRDHKNMVNRLNNCELANQEKVTQNGLKQIEDIKYLEDNGLMDLLDEKVKTVIEYRLKYPESSYQELADIISLETDYQLSKSGINHNFIKIRDLIKKHQENH